MTGSILSTVKINQNTGLPMRKQLQTSRGILPINTKFRKYTGVWTFMCDNFNIIRKVEIRNGRHKLHSLDYLPTAI